MSTSLSFALIGVGWIGGFHAETLADRLPDVRLADVHGEVFGSGGVLLVLNAVLR
jgi:myo-inositol 2-dehydrogenase / D-chiro-inositol 1-dehydrogenase